ncbi:Katanin p60 ATPase-containing subunit A1 [Diatrype stigma]|uniref:Katanin p60 ATPase-containing subunit A1 n=1 Tax=Diatrype stigma TaxID=117547 RepID=A0AAN9UWE9_9PEZI
MPPSLDVSDNLERDISLPVLKLSPNRGRLAVANTGTLPQSFRAPFIDSIDLLDATGMRSLHQEASELAGHVCSSRSTKDDWLLPRKQWDELVSTTLTQCGLSIRDCCELRYGNPGEPATDELIELFSQAAYPALGEEVSWYAYNRPKPDQVKRLAKRLSEAQGVEHAPEDILVVDGSLAALDLLAYVALDVGDEAILLTPAYFNYPVIIQHRQGKVKYVPVDKNTLEPDVEAIRRAIGPKTRCIFLTCPNNPTGVVPGRHVLEKLSNMLLEVNKQRSSPILVISDEAYRRILFTGAEFTSITSIYPYSVSTYTTGKTLLAPGQRLGYIAIPSIMPAPHRRVLRRALTVAQNSSWAFPSATIMNCLDTLDTMQIDLRALENKRDYFCGRLQAAGYQLKVPQGTFYVCISIPGWVDVDDDHPANSTMACPSSSGKEIAFCLDLARKGVLVMPGSLFGWAGVFRISLTAPLAALARTCDVLESIQTA